MRRYWRENISREKTLGIALEAYEATPVFIPVDNTEEVVESVAKNLSVI